MSNTPFEPRDRPGYRDEDDVRTNPYGVPVDRGAYGTEPVDRGAYGTEPVVAPGGYPVGVRNGAGTAALVFGILGLLTAVFLVGGVLGLVAVIAGAVGLGRVNRREATNRGSAMAGVVLGLVAIAISVSVGVLAYNNRDNIENLTDCLADASTAAATASCRDRFQEDVTR